jgi:hypothetical protein
MAEKLIVQKMGFGFFDGGCRIFAEAASLALPGARAVTLLRDGKPDHYGVCAPRFGYGDFGGVYENPEARVARYALYELKPLSLLGRLSVKDGIVFSPEVEAPRDLVGIVLSVLSSSNRSW